MVDYLHHLQSSRRIVVKVGTSTLTDQHGKLYIPRMEQLVRQLIALRQEGREVALVSSGAIGVGLNRLGLSRRPHSIMDRQAIAAIGQGLLMQVYEKLFSEHDQIIAQVLLTRSDVSDRKRYLNARNTFLTLFDYQAIPIINENDTVATEELKIGENDSLSALVAGLIEADLLILLSDIDGLFTNDPRQNSEAQLIPLVTEVDRSIKNMAGGSGTSLGTGGMVTKLEAAQMAVSAGTSMIIMNGAEPEKIQKIFNAEPIGTVFLSQQPTVNSRKRWIAYGLQINGSVTVDHGAADAVVKQGKSLLPSGITALEGDFEEGDLLVIKDEKGMELGRGLTNYGREQLVQIRGKKTIEIENILGFKPADEVIHRDNMVVTWLEK